MKFNLDEFMKSVCVFTKVILFFSEASAWQVASQLNALLTSENERLKQLTDDLKQKHSHMTSEVRLILPYSSYVPFRSSYPVTKSM